MAKEVFHVRADMVDDAFWIETSATRAATVQLHATLELARAREVWMPMFCLTGPEGSGKTALAQRVARQAARNVACRLAGEAVARGATPDPHPVGAAAEAIWRAQATAHDFGHCPMVCSPMLYQPINVWDMQVSPGSAWHNNLLRNQRITPGNQGNDPLRRTSLVLVDEADHLLNLSEAKQRLTLDIMAMPNSSLTYVFIGGRRLAEALRRHGKLS